MTMDNTKGNVNDYLQCNPSGGNLVFDRPDAAQSKWLQLAKKD